MQDKIDNPNPTGFEIAAIDIPIQYKTDRALEAVAEDLAGLTQRLPFDVLNTDRAGKLLIYAVKLGAFTDRGREWREVCAVIEDNLRESGVGLSFYTPLSRVLHAVVTHCWTHATELGLDFSNQPDRMRSSEA